MGNWMKTIKVKVKTRDLPGGPVAKTPSSHARG